MVKTSSWIDRIALYTSEIEACGGCSNPLYFDGSVAQNQAVLIPGKYRMKQCQAPFTSTEQLCQAVPQYNTTIVYANTNNGIIAAQPFKSMFDQGYIVCSPDYFPGCPANYKCCMWNPMTQLPEWQFCMLQNYGADWPSSYPNCPGSSWPSVLPVCP